MTGYLARLIETAKVSLPFGEKWSKRSLFMLAFLIGSLFGSCFYYVFDSSIVIRIENRYSKGEEKSITDAWIDALDPTDCSPQFGDLKMVYNATSGLCTTLDGSPSFGSSGTTFQCQLI